MYEHGEPGYDNDSIVYTKLLQWANQPGNAESLYTGHGNMTATVTKANNNTKSINSNASVIKNIKKHNNIYTCAEIVNVLSHGMDPVNKQSLEQRLQYFITHVLPVTPVHICTQGYIQYIQTLDTSVSWNSLYSTHVIAALLHHWCKQCRHSDEWKAPEVCTLLESLVVAVLWPCVYGPVAALTAVTGIDPLSMSGRHVCAVVQTMIQALITVSSNDTSGPYSAVCMQLEQLLYDHYTYVAATNVLSSIPVLAQLVAVCNQLTGIQAALNQLESDVDVCSKHTVLYDQLHYEFKVCIYMMCICYVC